MWIYEKRLEFPVNIKEPNAKMAMFIMSQYGGPDGEMGASMRYLSQRYSMPYKECKAVLTDIGTEELAHLEIVAAIVHQLTRNLTAEQLVTILPGSGLRLQAVYRLMPVNSRAREILSPIFMKIWLRMVQLHKCNIEVLSRSSI